MQYPKKLKVVEKCSDGIGNFKDFRIIKYTIPHEGIITITKDGNIEIENSKETSTIYKCDGIIDEYREIINDRLNSGDKVKNMIKENAAVVPVTATKIAFTAAASAI